MHKYFIKTPWIVKKIFSNYVWDVQVNEKIIYLTFDDGPHPQITPWVLNELKKYNALGTFFCVGKNVELYPEIYNSILSEGHATGNHTFNHLDGWKVKSKEYINDISKASELITSSLFRPPYGKIKRSQALLIHKALNNYNSKIIMWDVLSADFDQSISHEECLQNIIKNVTAGSIVVFHDSEKAFLHLKYVLPKILNYLAKEEFLCKKLVADRLPAKKIKN